MLNVSIYSWQPKDLDPTTAWIKISCPNCLSQPLSPQLKCASWIKFFTSYMIKDLEYLAALFLHLWVKFNLTNTRNLRQHSHKKSRFFLVPYRSLPFDFIYSSSPWSSSNVTLLRWCTGIDRERSQTEGGNQKLGFDMGGFLEKPIFL